MLATFKAPSKGMELQIIHSKDVLAVLPTGFGKSLFQLIPGLCVELQYTMLLMPVYQMSLEQHFEHVFSPLQGTEVFCNNFSLGL